VTRYLAAVETLQRTFGRLRITLTGAREHPVDSSQEAFAAATTLALQNALVPDNLACSA
jgi:hypothetical protein